MKRKIPFGWNSTEQRYVDANSSIKGVRCNCICPACQQPLEAVKGEKRVHYFRHQKFTFCDGNPESLYHKVAKQIIQESKEILQFPGRPFQYDICELEKQRHGKRPDVYLFNSRLNTGLIVEIVFSHKIEPETLKTYIENGEKVMEITISFLKNNTMTYEQLRHFILSEAPREMKVLATAKSETEERVCPIFMILLTIFTFIATYLWWKRKKYRH